MPDDRTVGVCVGATLSDAPARGISGHGLFVDFFFNCPVLSFSCDPGEFSQLIASFFDHIEATLRLLLCASLRVGDEIAIAVLCVCNEGIS